MGFSKSCGHISDCNLGHITQVRWGFWSSEIFTAQCLTLQSPVTPNRLQLHGGRRPMSLYPLSRGPGNACPTFSPLTATPAFRLRSGTVSPGACSWVSPSSSVLISSVALPPSFVRICLYVCCTVFPTKLGVFLKGQMCCPHICIRQ